MASNATEADAKAEEYESDPEDLPLPAMRRREAASDDEEEEESDGGEDPAPKKNESVVSRNARSDGDSDGQGGAEEYDEDDVDEYDELEEEYDELGEEYEEELEGENRNGVVEEKRQGELGGDNREGNGEENIDGENKEGEKKENEPYAVPTTGAFYMHDDRFQENGRGGGRRRRMHGGGRKIWNPKDERAWVHDRFEEMTVHEPRHDDDKRRSRGRYRGRGGSGGRGPRRVGGGGDRGGSYPRGGRGSRTYYEDGQNHNKGPRFVRGRGQRRYEPVVRNNSRNQPPQEKQILQRTNEKGSNPTAPSTGTNTRQHSQAQTSHTLSSSLPKKQAFSSSLNSASPPFYPSNSSNNNQDLSTAMRRDTQNSGPIQSDNRGKSIAVGSTLAPNSSTTSARVGRGVGNDNQMSRLSSQVPASVAQHRQVPVTPTHQVTSASMQPVSGTGSGFSEDGVNSGSPTNKLKGSLPASKGKAPGTGTGAVMYGGGQVIATTGAMSMAHGEQGFPGTPALLPVMQFSGQHHGVPAVGMALPGYVAQSQLGFGNSEMTWVPVLAGAAGTLGGSYCPPYIALDGGYYNNARPSSQISSSAPAREAGAAKSSDTTKSSQKPELPTEEPGQRQNKPRRYSEMNFGQ